MNELSLTVTEVNNFIKNMMDNEPRLSQVMVYGELSNYKIYPSGHHYFTLKDAESSLKCVMFRSNSSRLRFKPESGMSVTAIGRISVYPRDGVYQLYVNHMIPVGEGDLQIAFEQLKEKLEKQGLFDESNKKELPRFPNRIAIVTSSAGAAVHDMTRILRERWPLTNILLVPVRVQGDEAPDEIAEAIRYVNEYKLSDLIITGRGGGSIEDLWAFNSEKVAFAIYKSSIPVISAVGHEPDVTISDYVADIRASTPSNAAEIAVPNREEMFSRIDYLRTHLIKSIDSFIQYYIERLNTFSNSYVLQSPFEYINNKGIELDRITEQLINGMLRQVANKNEKYIEYAAKLDAMSPLKVLSRGYLIAQKENSIVRSVHEVSTNDLLRLRLSDGDISCRVLDVYED